MSNQLLFVHSIGSSGTFEAHCHKAGPRAVKYIQTVFVDQDLANLIVITTFQVRFISKLYVRCR